jgi:hypothetical protein
MLLRKSMNFYRTTEGSNRVGWITRILPLAVYEFTCLRHTMLALSTESRTLIYVVLYKERIKIRGILKDNGP